MLPASVIMGYMTLRVITVHDRRKSKQEQIKNYFKELGIKNFDVSSLNENKLTKEGFQRLIWIIRESKPSGQTGSGPMGQLSALMEGLSTMRGGGISQAAEAPKVE